MKTCIHTVMSFRAAGCALTIAAAFLVVSGCGSKSSESTPLREFLPTGVERVTYEALPPVQLTFNQMAEWDVWDPQGAYLFNQISDAVGGTGSFFLLDDGNNQVVELAVDGSLLNTIGRQGSGPGELRFPLQLDFHDKQLWISDVGNRRFSVYELDGTYVRDVKWPGASRLVNRFSVTPSGRIVHGGMWPLTVAELADQEPLFYLALFPAEGEWEEGWAKIHVDTLATMESLPYMATEIRSVEGDVRTWFGNPELAPQLLWSAGEELIATVTSEDYRFEVREPDGEIVLEVVAPTPELRVTEAHKQWFFRYEAPDRLMQYGSFTLTSDSRARIPFAERMPAIAGISVDRMGRVWVLANTGEPGLTRLDIFERDGRYRGHLGSLPLPAAFNCDGYVLFRERSEDGLDRFLVGAVGWVVQGKTPDL